MPRYLSRTIYYPDARPSDASTINLEWDGPLEIDDPLVETSVNLIVTEIANGLFTPIFIDHTTFGTWVEDGTPYDPETLRTFNHGFYGTKALGVSSLLDDTIALFVRKNVASGRSGKFFFRWALRFVDVVATAGSWALDSGARTVIDGWLAALFTAFEDSPIIPSLIGQSLVSITYPATPEGVKQVPEYNYAPNEVSRRVTGLVAVGPRERQENNN
jgi:hypothetical protein